jgi:hypothetical protein
MASEPLDLASLESERALDGEQAIPIVATTTVAFIGRTERGPLNEPVAIRDFDDYRRIFGGYCKFSFVPYAVQHFFLHGGEAAVIVRVANRATRALLEVSAGTESLRLQARNPGSREFLRVSVDYDRVENDPSRFNLVVQRLSRIGSQLVDDQELFQAVSMEQSDDRHIAAALRDSELVRLSGPPPACRPDATRATRPGEPIPYLGMCLAGSDGEELTDYDIIGSNREGTGLFALDRCSSIDLLCIPSPPGHDLGITSFVAAARYCERRRAMLVWDPPWSWYSPDAAILSVRSTGQVSANAITYFPRVRPRAEQRIYPSGMPACGVVAGILARSDRNGVWHRLPLTDSGLKANLVPLVDVDAKQTGMLNRIGVNALGRAQAGGAALQGNVSFAGPNLVSSLWQRLDTRRLTLFILRSIEQHTRWVSAAPAADLAATLERQVWIFLARIHQQGALVGKTSEQAFFARARVAGTPTTASSEASAALTLRIGFALQKANEFVVYEFRYDERGVSGHGVPVLDAERYVG